MTYHDLAEIVLRDSETPLTANEIWELAVQKGLDAKLTGQGKTPWATLAARLYVIVRDQPGGRFATVGKRPKRFYLTNKKYDISFEDYEKGLIEDEVAIEPEPKETQRQKSYLEKDLHPFLAHFAHYNLRCYTKTLNHSTSSKKEFGEWVHPDMVGCVFPIGEWENEVLDLSKAIGNVSVKLFSFELKRELNLSTLRESFFQAVSNSSWANESYLAAAEISKNEDFRSELGRLSTSFGIGVIRLDVEDPNSSETLFPAKAKENLDWETINKLTMNKDFREFLKRVKIDLTSNEIRSERYDKVLGEEALIKLIQRK